MRGAPVPDQRGRLAADPLSPTNAGMAAAVVEPTRRDGGATDSGSIFGNVRTRVLASLLALLILSTGASLLVLRSVLLSRIGENVEQDLTRRVDDLRAIAASDVDPRGGGALNGDLGKIFDAFIRTETPLDGTIIVTYIGGRVYRAAPAAQPPAGLVAALGRFAAIDQPGRGEIDSANGLARYVAVPIQSGGTGGVVVAADLLANEREQVEGAIRIAVGVSFVVMLLASLFIWLAAGRAIAPLRALARAARNITDTDLSQRVEARGSDEIAVLGHTFNDMLDRLQHAFADQKEFLADVGHELRTPITVIRGHIETLGDNPIERREATSVIGDELDRMSRLVDDLLLLARSDRPDFLRIEPIDVDLLTHDLYNKARSLGERRWSLDRVGIGLIHGDQHRLTSAMMNLAQNAVRHTRTGELVSIGSSIAGGEARLWVRDEGDGIAPADQERIFERFARVEATGPGAGLGLAIVRAIAHAHGGRVELSSYPGAGSTFTVVVPIEEGEEASGWPES